ncbi:Glycoside hydrolase subgroup catalytic core [Lasiodiplodia theobromae]|uniref:Glycoside hydrolase subgroup catalytic core n=1 Tax=Lasiodiplodia theobromae TaxID=45133 RepID=UPI0015C40AE4|nr:Glycoside hydrolase subgroup catalytic core [Lasiodiplodia theobromae]KAF4540796.1 Glycoside hydrolase subgroup catalytic core [Lasiodiplodia theobromae]
MRYSSLLGLAAGLTTAAAQIKGFNYGNTLTTGAPKSLADFTNEFNLAKNLVGASGFTSARLYTMIQGGTTNTPISAIQAAIDTKTTLLLGLWASAGQASFDNEVAALKAAIAQYGSAFTDLIVGISVGSEDLYRNSPTGIINKSGYGADPAVLVSYIEQVRAAIAGTPASGASIGHVDTWTAFVNGSNSAVVDAVDWLGFDGYPYFQNTQANGIGNAKALFDESVAATKGAAKGKPVWITETGWPVSGPTENEAVASVENAKTYWDEVGCPLFGNTNTWWYTLQDAVPDTPSPSFGLVAGGSSTPLFDLTCGAAGNDGDSASSSAVSSAASSAAASSAHASTAASASTAPSQPAGGASSAASSAASAPAGTTAAPAPSGTATSPGGDDAETTVIITITTTYCPTPGVTSTATTTTALTHPSSSGFQTTTTAPSTPSSTSKSCPANLSGTYEYPHLIVPVDSAAPTKAHGTSYNGQLSATLSTLFNFDIPASYAGKTCSLVFLLPEKKDLETSDFTLSGAGGIAVSKLAAPATEATTYESVPASAGEVGGVEKVTPGNAWVVASAKCEAGSRIGYEVKATGGLELEWFEDWNPSPIGLFVRVC